LGDVSTLQWTREAGVAVVAATLGVHLDPVAVHPALGVSNWAEVQAGYVHGHGPWVSLFLHARVPLYTEQTGGAGKDAIGTCQPKQRV
jgi:hypothetical protein